MCRTAHPKIQISRAPNTHALINTGSLFRPLPIKIQKIYSFHPIQNSRIDKKGAASTAAPFILGENPKKQNFHASEKYERTRRIHNSQIAQLPEFRVLISFTIISTNKEEEHP